MHNCRPEIGAVSPDGLQFAVDALTAFPTRTRTGSTGVPERLAAVAELCQAVDGALDALVVRTAAEAAEEGWTSGQMAAEHSAYHARLRRALLTGPVGSGAGAGRRKQ
ncbi:hypothetical protein [Kitasatospora sp. GP82]|uniref:hypothetical protein n=1 Tax=Kitasatospora sp. GP82 TaxID=3035089 RepID=UPI002473DE04|nr:hypothetical protein [Kitasatospora sp. GP82]MDH6126481.1 hypothetical protein [Kitasatospora sp. GP82]